MHRDIPHDPMPRCGGFKTNLVAICALLYDCRPRGTGWARTEGCSPKTDCPRGLLRAARVLSYQVAPMRYGLGEGQRAAGAGGQVARGVRAPLAATGVSLSSKDPGIS